MDTRTKNAIQQLHSRILPGLTAEIGEVAALAPNHDVAPTNQMVSLIEEAQSALAAAYLWAVSTSDRRPDVNVSAPRAPMPTPASAKEPPAPKTDDPMSDEEAMMLLAEMDEPTVTAAPPTPTPSPAAAPADASMSDEEAAMLLAAMDDPMSSGISGDAGSAAPTAATTTVPVTAATEDSLMSDEEAMKLLSAMDAPAPPSAFTIPDVPETDMSDDEAARLLAQMDSPNPPPKVTPAAPAPAPAAPRAAAPTPAPTIAAPAPTLPAGVEDAGEIPEWEKNEFQSDPEMLKGYINDTEDLMSKLDSGILALEQNPSDKETIEGIFRAAHTIKGSSGMFGFKGMERVMHRAENLFDLVRKGSLQPTSDHIDLMFKAMDVIRTLIDAVKNGSPCGAKTAPIVNALTAAAQGKIIAVAGATPPAAAPTAAPTASAPAANAETAPAPVAPAANAPASANKPQTESTIRVDIERLDNLVNLIGELVTDRTRFVTIEQDLRSTRSGGKHIGALTETVQLFGRHLNEIQETTMKLRMVPIGSAFTKFIRVVRDLGRQLGKEINLDIDGETTELDKTIVEQIGDPLVHLVRNSCDHGIEMPNDRLAAGKPRGGTIRLSAAQEGNSIIITIEDDGKGMDPERLRRKAIEKGLVKEDAVMSQREIFNLIFEAGFSTAEKVTNVSGRGVGMDVVRKQIAKLKGLIDIDSAVGKGSKITIRLPLTLAIVQNLLVNVQGETLAIPLSGVIESIRIPRTEIQRVGNAEVIKLRDHVLPLIHLNQVLNLSERDGKFWYTSGREAARAAAVSGKRNERLFVVVVGSAEWRMGLVVDALVSQQEMVIKGLGPIMADNPCVAGGAVLGNGEVVLVLDIIELENLQRAKARVS